MNFCESGLIVYSAGVIDLLAPSLQKLSHTKIFLTVKLQKLKHGKEHC